MNVTEKRMIDLIKSGKSGQASSNTRVVQAPTARKAKVYLFSKHIATYNKATRELTLYDAGWQTVTTKSRLNALLEAFAPAFRIVQRQHVWYVDNLAQDEPTLTPWESGWIFN